MFVVIAISVTVWSTTRDTLPETLRIATAETGGLYHRLGNELGDRIQRRTGRDVILLPSEGSVENRGMLLAGKAHAAILQSGGVSTEGLAVIAPLYPEVVHVVVREERGIERIEDLAGRRMLLGAPGSGMRLSAQTVLSHYGIPGQVTDRSGSYFRKLLEDESLDGAIITTGILNADLEEVMATGDFRLLPIRAAAAIEMKDAFLHRITLPRGLFHERPPIPAQDVETLATTAVLAARNDASAFLITTLLQTLHEEGLSQEFPILHPYHEALDRSPVPLHPTARRYFDPPDQIGLMASVLESLAAFKELLFALAAGAWLLWDRWQRHQAKAREKVLIEAKDRLDAFLDRTLKIERAQLGTTDPEELKEFLDQVTSIKLEALEQLTHEELRSDQAFAIFLAQCANLINKIQFKIGSHAGNRT